MIYMYTPPKKKLLAFSFANFEMTIGSPEKAYVLWTDQKSYSPIFELTCAIYHMQYITCKGELHANVKLHFLKFKLNK